MDMPPIQRTTVRVEVARSVLLQRVGVWRQLTSVRTWRYSVPVQRKLSRQLRGGI